ncbi:penicillin-binding protein activator [Paracoccus shanxieyensis]|uniref:ABC transporter substrate-binding protein n=1 Tax=Paracoccus shanxieyensis TaxID=2675752 RepID=A0A6L6IWX4_9RHOB|nr:penicillin-binding protein activator [Paracoccus shanxieyensis]MTH63782.1 ABC transporter substrate-binding protein [Paracoccus shanxieyensis]MTH86707.1 ABC transporter substrate-binding protein [Paracoccus shanxieyensis]
MTAKTTIRGSFSLRRPFARIAAIASALVLAACEPIQTGASSGSTGQSIDPSQPVQVALLVPGGAPDLDWLARSLTNSARMAAADAQGATIDVRVYNAGSDPATAVAQATQAADQGAKIILGPLFADSANAVGNAMAPRGINVLSFSNNADIAGGNVFVLGNTFANTANRLVKYAKDTGRRRIMVVAEDDAAGQIGAQAIQQAIQRNGVVMAGMAVHPVSREGIDGVIPNIQQAAQSGNVDAIFMTANQGAVLPYLTDGLANAGVTSATVQMMGLTRWDQPSERLGLRGIQGGWFALPDNSMKAQFEQRYRSAYGEAPHDLASLSYDGVAAIAALVRAGKRNALTTAGLTQNAGFAGVTGAFRLNRDGTNDRALSVATITGGRVQILDPAPKSFGGSGF